MSETVETEKKGWLSRLRAVTSIPIAVDQTAYSADDVFELCRNRAADVIVLGLHETCGVLRFRKAAARRLLMASIIHLPLLLFLMVLNKL